MKKLNFSGVTVQTWTRTIVLLLALISQFLVVIGKRTEEIDIDKTTEIINFIFTALASVWCWWKNNSFTKGAQDADIMRESNITLPAELTETGIVTDEDGNEVM